MEIDQNDRLVNFIDELTTTLDQGVALECEEDAGRSDTQSLRRVAAAIVSISELVTSEAANQLNLLKR